MEKTRVDVSKPVAPIRANPAQTALLKKAFAISATVSLESLQVLSVQTELPSRWINNWFGRQRNKSRKSKAKLPEGSASSPSTVLSSSEILGVKLEAGSPVSLALSSPIPEAVQAKTSQSVTTHRVVQSVAGPSRRRRGRPKRKKTPEARNLRSGATQVPVSTPTLDKVDFLDTSEDLRYTPPSTTEVENPVLSAGLDSHNGYPASVIDTESKDFSSTLVPAMYSHLLPSIAPPKRSPVTTGNKITGSSLQNYRSSLSNTGQFESIYSAFSTNPGSLPTYRNNKPQKMDFPRQGPLLSTRFLNAPSIYPSNVNFVPATSSGLHAAPDMVSEYRHHQAFTAAHDVPEPILPLHEPQVGDASHPLAPAFDWENHAPSPSFSSFSSHIPTFQGNQHLYYYSGDPSVSASINFDYNSQPQIVQENVEIQYQASDYCQPNPVQPESQIPNSYQKILDPGLAPLKYLTDILEAFKDEQGTYMKLAAFEEHDNLRKTLLDDNSVKSNPFQAAMALSLMSKLGLQWEY